MTLLDPLVLEDLFVQLVQQGQRLGRLDGLVRTRDQQAFLTSEHINSAIRDFMASKGRASVAEVADVLNIEHQAVLEAWSLLAPQEHWTMTADLLMTSEYLCLIPSQLTTFLEPSGYGSLVTLAQHLKLPYHFLVEVLEPAIAEHYVRYPQVSELILTKHYANEAKKGVTDALEQTTEPLSMLKLQRKCGVQEALFYAILETVIRDEQLSGTFRGRREKAIFIPHSFKDRQISLINSLLEAAGYIEYDTVEQHYAYVNPKDLLQRQDQDIVLLDTCGVTQSLIKNLEEKMEQELNTKGWCDVAHLAPFAFSTSDIESTLDFIISRSNRQTKRDRKVLANRFIVTSDFLSKIVKVSQGFLERLALKEIQQEKKQHSSKGNRRLAGGADVELKNEEIYTFLTEESLPSEFAENLVPLLRRPMKDVLLRATRTVYVAPSLIASEENPETHLERANLIDMARKIYFTYKAISVFEDEAARKSIEKYIVRQLGLQFLYSFMELEELEKTGDRQTTAKKFNPGNNDEKKKELLSTYFEAENADLVATIITGKKANLLINFIQGQPHFRDEMHEDKLERVNEEIQSRLGEQLEATPVTQHTAASILHLTSILYFQTLYHQPLYVSGKFVPHIIKQITQAINETDAELLKEALAMASLKNSREIDLDLFQKVHTLGLEKIKK
ncbi:hypothetical protein BX666DRAFT_1982279 [Dichotomocladium elegans]|nr:hypothetical protein BX666DRAFT_1982279 [Dichotomocladium elegans]